MNNHVSQWLNAYHDDELRPHRRAIVEAHLEECPQCRAELAELQTLSTMLQADLLPQMRTSPEQFAAQVALRLPRRETRRQNGSNFRWLWYMVPVGILIGMGVQRVIVTVSELLLWIERLGMNPNAVSQILPEPTTQTPPGIDLLAQFSNMVLHWNNPFQTTLGLTLLLPAALAIGYMIWMLLWWVEQNQESI